MNETTERVLDLLKAGAEFLSGEEIGYAMIKVAEAAAATDAASFFRERFGVLLVRERNPTLKALDGAHFLVPSRHGLGILAVARDRVESTSSDHEERENSENCQPNL